MDRLSLEAGTVMRWWTHLYMGEHAERRRDRVLQKIREKKPQPDAYLITPPQYGHHLLDIRPARLLTDEERESGDFLILGVACGYSEAKEVVRQMVDDMYRATGGFDWQAYMELLDCGAQDAGEMGE